MDGLFEQLVQYAGDDYDESMDDFLHNLLTAALAEVRNTAFPFGFEDEDEKGIQEELTLIQYSNVVLQIAEYHFDKIGTENGTYSYYENAGTPKSYLRQVMPTAMFV